MRPASQVVVLAALLGLTALTGCTRGSGPQAPVEPTSYRVEVVRTLKHDPAAYTQGLCFLGDRLFESTGQYGASTIRELDPTTGAVLRKQAIEARFFGEGLAGWDGELVQLTWMAKTAIRYRADDFSEVRRHPYAGQGWGLTTDGRHWIQSNGTDTLTFRDRDTFAVQRRIRVTARGRAVSQLNELEWVDGELWANVYQVDRIARIDPATGVVTGWIDGRDLRPAGVPDDLHHVLNGIAWHPDSGRLLLTGKQWPVLYEVRVVPAE